MLSAPHSQTDSSVSSALFAVGFFMKAREGVETKGWGHKENLCDTDERLRITVSLYLFKHICGGVSQPSLIVVTLKTPRLKTQRVNCCLSNTTTLSLIAFDSKWNIELWLKPGNKGVFWYSLSFYPSLTPSLRQDKEEQWMTKLVPGAKDHALLHPLQWNTRYEVEITARNVKGLSEPTFYQFFMPQKPDITGKSMIEENFGL